MSLLNEVGEGYAERGSRPLVPESYYPVKLEVGEIGASEVRDDGSGGAPFFTLQGEVQDGPFKGHEPRSRIYFSPGKTGGFLGWFRHNKKVVTGSDFDGDAFTAIGFDQNLGLEAFVSYWADLDPEARQEFMVKLLGLATWDGKVVVGSIGCEQMRDSDNFANIWKGFFAVNDPKKGLEYCRKVAFQKQQSEADSG